ncbi:OmpA family protein [Candidatus Entotheonella palauensis]|uniref:OmpA family protein n=1 Tax=Candidatus Entotheonella palauensis TaxID=93172 RepID=UPI0015C4C247|nr:OmpA family protein [Candidatus Entotheonella palauensis]
MQLKTLMTGLFAGVLLLGFTGVLAAEPLKNRVDFTGRYDVSEDEIIAALTPIKMRGMRTRGLEIERRIAMTINFAFDSAELLPETIPNLRRLGGALQSPQLAPYRIRIEGHTDSIGTKAYNQTLSQRRANAVKVYLVKQFNIAPDHLETVGQGELEPIHDNRTAEGRKRNRRAEFVTLNK